MIYMKKSSTCYKVCFHLTLFEKVMNFIMVQHGYRRRIIRQADSEKRLHRQFIRRASNGEEHIITANWWCKPAMMMDYHFRLVMRTNGDTYQCQCSSRRL